MRWAAWTGVAAVLGAGTALVAGSTGDGSPGTAASRPAPPDPAAATRGTGEAPAPSPQEDYNTGYDGRFTFARIRFDSPPGRGYARGQPPWAHDYPRAERHLMRILDEVTLLGPYMDGGNVYDLDDPGLMKHPVAYLSEPGYWLMSDGEAAAFREYLEKGGFVIVDDFRGGHWVNFERQLARVLPEARLVRLDVSHPIFHAFFDVESLDFSAPTFRYMQPSYYGVFEDNDPEKRLMLVANYNNDIGDYWEWSDRDYLPIELSNEAYKLGVNYIVYGMTH